MPQRVPSAQKDDSLLSFLRFVTGFLTFIGISFGISYGINYLSTQQVAAAQNASVRAVILDH